MTTFCLIDPSVTCFDGESLLNALFYGSDEFNNKLNKEILLSFVLNRTGDIGVAKESWPPTFLCSKNKIEKQREKKKEFQSRNY